MTFDIFTNRVQFGLLTAEEQQALKDHCGKIECYRGAYDVWTRISKPPWSSCGVYRAVSAPAVVEKDGVYLNYDDMHFPKLTNDPASVTQYHAAPKTESYRGKLTTTVNPDGDIIKMVWEKEDAT